MSRFKHISVRIPIEEDLALDLYCQRKGRTKTDVLREFIRSLDFVSCSPNIEDAR